jgi:hypothetical protein
MIQDVHGVPGNAKATFSTPFGMRTLSANVLHAEGDTELGAVTNLDELTFEPSKHARCFFSRFGEALSTTTPD